YPTELMECLNAPPVQYRTRVGGLLVPDRDHDLTGVEAAAVGGLRHVDHPDAGVRGQPRIHLVLQLGHEPPPPAERRLVLEEELHLHGSPTDGSSHLCQVAD